MKESLIANQKKDINSPLNLFKTKKRIKSLFYDNDIVYDVLRFSGGKSSNCKRTLARILSRIYRYQILIIIISLIIGFIFFAIPLIFIYIKLLNNIFFHCLLHVYLVYYFLLYLLL
jgi:hypothetical protein